MADYYCTMSEMLVLKTKEEVKWVEEILEKIEEVVNSWSKEEKDFYANYPAWIADWCDTYNEVGFEWKTEKNGLWIHGDCVNVDAIAEFVRRFLKEFHPDAHWSMTWAETCSKPAIGEFHGGVAFVTANRAHFLDSWAWLSKKRKEYEQKRRKKK